MQVSFRFQSGAYVWQIVPNESFLLAKLGMKKGDRAEITDPHKLSLLACFIGQKGADKIIWAKIH